MKWAGLVPLKGLLNLPREQVRLSARLHLESHGGQKEALTLKENWKKLRKDSHLCIALCSKIMQQAQPANHEFVCE